MANKNEEVMATANNHFYQNRMRSKAFRKKTSKERLAEIISKRITTAFIGALDRFERNFGKELWNHGEDIENCDDDDVFWRRIWQKCRNEILDNGNDQILGTDELESISSLLDQYEIEFVGRHLRLKEIR